MCVVALGLEAHDCAKRFHAGADHNVGLCPFVFAKGAVVVAV